MGKRRIASDDTDMLDLIVYQLVKKALTNGKNEGILRARKKLMILLRDNFECVRCGSQMDLTIDHRESPKDSMSYTHDTYSLETCHTLCIWCHMEKNGVYDNMGVGMMTLRDSKYTPLTTADLRRGKKKEEEKGENNENTTSNI